MTGSVPCPKPLQGIRVLDFSTLLPGPLATLILAEAGAEVVKVERPQGEEGRTNPPRFGADSLNFVLLHRGKRSVALDLRTPEGRAALMPLVERADVLVEQFRPGVMDRLGLGWEDVRKVNPRIVYCAITGYGQDGPRAQVAGHDLNYVAESGLLSLTTGPEDGPALPPTLIADIGGGTMPAVINILLALRQRDLTGHGCKLDIAMAENVFAFAHWATSRGFATGTWPARGAEKLNGGSPRYNLYRTAEGRFVAAAPLEQKFWDTFCDAIGLEPRWRDDAADPRGTRDAVAALLRTRDSAHWREAFAGKDACAVVVATMEEAVTNPALRARGLFVSQVGNGERGIPAAHVPLAPVFRGEPDLKRSPALGEDNGLVGLGAACPSERDRVA